MTKTVPWAGLLVACCVVLSCGSDDSGSGGAGGGAAGTGAAGGAAGGGAGGSSGVGGTNVLDAGPGGSGGGSDLCTATTNPFDATQIDCQLACDHFLLWCDASSPCASPYCDSPSDCVTACVATKASIPYVNAQWGCAAENDACDLWLACLNGYCK